MTSDAKIGLLLGLVFIFIIAFIINGLPSFRHNESDNSDLTSHMVNQRGSAGIGEREREARKEIIHPANQFNNGYSQRISSDRTLVANNDERFRMDLPRISGTAPARPVEQLIKVPSESYQPVETSKTVRPLQPVNMPRTNKPALERFYVVAKGDSLASIAKRFYGPEEGNRRVNIDKIYLANKGILKSKDNILVGQKLVIPSLSKDIAGSGNKSVLNSNVFTKVESIGRKGLFGSQTSASRGRSYTVKKGENLWAIAEKELGNGSRYKEITRLNKIKDADTVEAGTKLTLPVK
jgi:LysM repeat protein